MLYITTGAGRRFRARCVRNGECYGLDNALLHEQDDPLLEVTDVTHGDPHLTGDNRFVACYPAQHFLEHHDQAVFWLKGEHMAWRLSPGQVRELKEWVRAGCPG